MDTYIYELTACVIVTVYLISGRFRWFGRSEIYRDVKHECFESGTKVKAFFRSAVLQSKGEYDILVKFRKELLRVQDKNGADMFYFLVDEDFLQKSSSTTLGRAAKLAGFIEFQANPGKLADNMLGFCRL